MADVAFRLLRRPAPRNDDDRVVVGWPASLQEAVVVPEGLEPPTPTLGMWRSILLSYGTSPFLI